MSVLLATMGYGKATKEQFQRRIKHDLLELSWAHEATLMVIDIRATPGTINGDWCKAISLQAITEVVARKGYAEGALGKFDGIRDQEGHINKRHWYNLGENLWNTLDDMGIHYEWWPSMGNTFGGSLAQLMWWRVDREYTEAFREFEAFVIRMYREGNMICLLCSERVPFDSKGRPKCHRIILSKILERRNPMLELLHLE